MPSLSPSLLTCSPAVTQALAEGRPVVALESTIITHGMPYPANLETALSVEAAVREGGAVPATIALMNGRIRVGLNETEISELAQAQGVIKTSRRDMAYVLAQGLTGATTVSGTMLAAHAAGIGVFVTGGIGGVHRGAERTFDVSADLTELARTPVAVVCAGVKSILDVGLTLEYLETHGVPVLGYGTDRFPAFYLRDGGFPVTSRLDSAREVAGLLRAQWALELGGVVVANPIPAADELPPAEVRAAIAQALSDADAAGITGKEVTPYLLGRLNTITAGRSQTANVALVLNNARVGAAIAVALSQEPKKLA